MKKIHASSQFHQEAQTIIILGDLCSHSIILSLKKLAKFQSMIIFVIHSKRWWETVPMPQLKLDHYFWNLIYAKTHLSLSKNKIEHKLALLKQYKMPFWKRCSQSSNNYYCYKWLCVIDQHSVKMAGYWPNSFFLRGQYPAIFIKQAWLIGWFAHFSCQSEHRICFILPARGFNKSALNPRSVQA